MLSGKFFPKAIVLFFLFLFPVFFFPASSQDWTEIKGKVATDVAVSKDGSVLITDRNGDIHKYANGSWQTLGSGGGAVRIAADPQGRPWVLNRAGNIHQFDGSRWVAKPGAAHDIAIGANGQVWVIGTGQVPGGYEIYRWKNEINNWEKIPGGALRIAVDPNGHAWVINNSNNIFQYNGSSFVMKPGGLKDIGVGANGDVWGTGPDNKIYKWDGNNWSLKTGGASQVSVGPDGKAWVVNDGGQLWQYSASLPLVVREVFPRRQQYEDAIIRTLKLTPNNIVLQNQPMYGVTTTTQGRIFSSLSPLEQALGTYAMLATEIYYSDNKTITADNIISLMQSSQAIRSGITGLMGVLVLNEMRLKGKTDAPSVALRKWSTDLYRGVKVRCAKSVLDEYQKWKADFCTYERISPEECRVLSQGIGSLFSSRTPPQDLIGNNGLQNALQGNTGAIAAGISTGVAALSMTAAAAAVATGVGVVVGTSATASVAGAPIVVATTCLYSAFGGTTSTLAGASSTAAIGATSWAGVVAAPVAAAVLAIVVGTMEGIKVVEAAKVEPMLKMKLGAAMTEHIVIENELTEQPARDMFFIAFHEAAQNGFAVPLPKVDGEVRFYCQAGYMSKFGVSYAVNGITETKETPDLAVGHEHSIKIPYNATNIRVYGKYLLGSWQNIFQQNLSQPTYICYTSYGTVFQPSYKTDCPEVGNMVAAKNEVTLVNGGGYIAQFYIDYKVNGQAQRYNSGEVPVGWRTVQTLPEGATDIRIQSWSKTGLVWEPWKTIVDKSFPTAPNICLKVFGTTLDPKWNNECK